MEIGQGGRKRNPRGVRKKKCFKFKMVFCSKYSVLSSEQLYPTILEFRAAFSKFRTKDLNSKHNFGVQNRSLEFKTRPFQTQNTSKIVRTT